MYVPVALGLVSFVGVWFLRGSLEAPVYLLTLSASNSLEDYIFGVIPLFVLMGLLVSQSELGRDIYEVANFCLRKLKGGLGVATVAANAAFAAITGVSIASASVFTRVSVPEMIRFGYKPRFAVGIVAGSSVLGMLIPPSVMLIIYAIITEQSVAAMFTAGILPGIVLALAYVVLIISLAVFKPDWVGWSRCGRSTKGQGPAAFVRVGNDPQDLAAGHPDFAGAGWYLRWYLHTNGGGRGGRAGRTGDRPDQTPSRSRHLVESAGGDRSHRGVDPDVDRCGHDVQPHAGHVRIAQRTG